MKRKQEFPDIDDFQLGKYRHGLSIQSQAIYLLALVAITVFILCLPFISIAIRVNSPGVLQTSARKVDVASTISGKVIKSRLRENQLVEQGDTLLLLDVSAIVKQLEMNLIRKTALSQDLKDIQMLLDNNLNSDLPTFRSGWYRSSHMLFLRENEEKQQAAELEARNFERFNALYQGKLISDSEFERHKYAFENARLAVITLHQRYKVQLEQEAFRIKEKLQILASAEVDLHNQQNLAVLTSPETGSLQLRKEIKVGTSIMVNEPLAEISPDSALAAYCYVQPADIAMIHIGQHVYFQVSAFNFYEWGVLPGRVQEISEDVLKINGVAVYQIRCLIDRDFMELKSGLRRSLRKGMTLNARFEVGKRSLSQLLYDRIDDWINPKLDTKSATHISRQSR